MADVRKMKAAVEAAIKGLDPKVITQGLFYDDASGRLFVTIIKGSRKVSVALRERDFSNGSSEKVSRAIEDGVERLKHIPIG